LTALKTINDTGLFLQILVAAVNPRPDAPPLTIITFSLILLLFLI